MWDSPAWDRRFKSDRQHRGGCFDGECAGICKWYGRVAPPGIELNKPIVAGCRSGHRVSGATRRVRQVAGLAVEDLAGRQQGGKTPSLPLVLS